MPKSFKKTVRGVHEVIYTEVAGKKGTTRFKRKRVASKPSSPTKSNTVTPASSPSKFGLSPSKSRRLNSGSASYLDFDYEPMAPLQPSNTKKVYILYYYSASASAH
jgi:hypothetical protein